MLGCLVHLDFEMHERLVGHGVGPLNEFDCLLLFGTDAEYAPGGVPSQSEVRYVIITLVIVSSVFEPRLFSFLDDSHQFVDLGILHHGGKIDVRVRNLALGRGRHMSLEGCSNHPFQGLQRLRELLLLLQAFLDS